MDINEIKKALLRQKPEAKLLYIRQGHVYYQTVIMLGNHEDVWRPSASIVFKVPVDDMGNTDFRPSMPGQSLIRWIYLPDNNETKTETL